MSSHANGVLQIVLSGAMFSFIGFIGKHALQRGVGPMEMLGFRFLVASAILFTVLALTRARLLRVTWRELAIFAALGVCGYSALAWSFFKALETISASLTVLLLYTYPLIVAVLAHCWLGEKIDARKLPWFALAMAGLVLLVWGDIEVKALVGVGYGLAAAGAYALYILASKKWLGETEPLKAVTYIQAASALLFLALSFESVARWQTVLASSWGLILFFALVPTLGAMLLFLEGLRRVKSWEASVLSLSEPVGGVLVSVLLLGEPLGGRQAFGGLVVLASLIAIAWPAKR
jgi:drug/metabolite transporter (DMT)-like permease